jgi:AraC family transcriptional regulator
MSLPTNLKSDDVVQVTSRLPRQAVVSPPHFKLGNLTARKSDHSGCAGLYVRVCDLPLCAHFVSTERSENAYHFYYRPRPEKGDMRLTIPAFGVVGRRNSRDDLLLTPPGIRVQAEWKSAAGSIATFFLKACFIKDIAERACLPAPYLEKSSLASFSIDQRLEVLCRLLIEETEDNCPHCPIYFEALARALVVSVLCRVRNPQCPPAVPNPHIPLGIRRAIERLEEDFIENISVTDLADHAHLSIDHFARIFRKVTGTTPHQYLLRVRLSHARKLMQSAQAIGLDEVALNCGFCDQAHFGRHFRRYFGITPAAFLEGAQEFPQGLTKWRKRSKVSGFIQYNRAVAA